MSDDLQPLPTSWRDGTSQAGRFLRELDPDYAQVDDRTTRDLLAFARAYARELKYFGLANPDEPQEDWSGFLGSVDLEAAARYAEEPETFAPEDAEPYARPHFALFLTFLKLLEIARSQLNTLTRRHLEFFYRDVLRMVRKKPVPDEVHVLVDLDTRTSMLRLPAGTALRAGRDSLGRDLVYLTNREIMASRAEVAQVSSLRADIRVTRIQDAIRRRLVGDARKDALVAMVKMALGEPNPGDALPVFVYPGGPPAPPGSGRTDPEATFQVLLQAQKVVDVVAAELGMPSFDDLRALMRLKRLRQERDPADWKQINGYLEKAGKARDPNFRFDPRDATDFQTNLRTALNKTADELASLYHGMPEVRSLEDAYAVYGARPDVAEFIQSKLYLSPGDFRAMMQTKVLMDSQWDEINRLLEEAGQRKRADPAFKLPARERASRNFDAKLTAAVNAPDYTVGGGLEGYYQAFLAVERYFFMPAERLEYIMSVATRAAAPRGDERDWDKVCDIVSAAHREKIYARRRDALRSIAQPGIAEKDTVKGLAKLLVAVLGEDLPVDEALRRLDSYGVTPDDLNYLKGIAAKSDSAPDWARVCLVLEIAQRNRENFQDPVAEKVEWRNLYPAPDAKAVVAQSAAHDVNALPRWKTFGRVEQAREPIPPGSFGWAVASPLLALGEGERTIDLTLGFSARPENFDLGTIRQLLDPKDVAPLVARFNPFRVEASTATGWLEPASVELKWANAEMGGYPVVQGVKPSELRALVFTLGLAKGEPALAPLTRDVHGIDTSAPVLRLMMKPVWSEHDTCYVTSYHLLRKLLLLRVHLVVTAAGLESLSIRNDQTTLDAKKPFEPFGSTPAAGSRFYLGHPELVAKKLDSVTFHIAWMGVPQKLLADHYRNYPVPLSNTSFGVKVGLVDANVPNDLSAPLSLFDGKDATRPVDMVLTPPADRGHPDSSITTPADIAEWNRYFVWELGSPDFQHAAYSTVALDRSLKMAAAIAKDPKTADPASYQVNPPYTPKIKSLTVDYSASADLAIDPVATGAVAMRVLHVEPFGYVESKPEGKQPGTVFLPQYDFEGELFIGMRNVTAPQNVSLLFQVAEGSADPDLAPEPVHWSYLSGNRWLSFPDGSFIADATHGLANSGIIELSLPPAEPSTLLPGSLYWIRAAIAQSADSVCDMIAIQANAALATFDDRDNAPDHLIKPLAPGRITGPQTPMPGIATIRQPYTSFGGKMAEQDASFYIRVSERLRHKQRALTPWDYERLVLEHFPQLYKAKCLRADPAAHAREPGRIELIVIPDIQNRLPCNPFEPKAPANLIRDIEAFLQDKTPAFASVTVKNAHYVPLKVRCGIRFLPGTDVGYCRRRLNEELNRFLSPWAYDDGTDIVIGGNVYANRIIDFIEQRDYVDYLAEFKLFTSSDDSKSFDLVPETPDYHAPAPGVDAVLVAAREHKFDVISHADYRVESFNGIGYMQIEFDFVIA